MGLCLVGLMCNLSCGIVIHKTKLLYLTVFPAMDGLEERLRHHSATFETMVELIPAKYYTVQDDSVQFNNKYWVNRKQRAPKQSVKEASKKAKRLNLDPDSHKSFRELQEEEARREAGNERGEESEEEEELNDYTRLQNGFSVERVKSGDLNELREKLKAKVEELRGKRKARDTEEGNAQKRQKRQDRKQRKKEMRLKEKQRKTSRQAPKSSIKDSRPSLEDKSGKIVYSKFDFSTPVKDWEPAGKKKDYKKLLAKAEATQRRLEELKKKDEKKGEDLEEKLNWQKAVELAKGTKLKDNPKQLKKTIKRLGKKKNRSQKQWEERMKQEKQMREKRQELRRKHLQERTEEIKAKKMKKRMKRRGKGQPRQPGF